MPKTCRIITTAGSLIVEALSQQQAIMAAMELLGGEFIGCSREGEW